MSGYCGFQALAKIDEERFGIGQYEDPFSRANQTSEFGYSADFKMIGIVNSCKDVVKISENTCEFSHEDRNFRFSLDFGDDKSELAFDKGSEFDEMIGHWIGILSICESLKHPASFNLKIVLPQKAYLNVSKVISSTPLILIEPVFYRKDHKTKIFAHSEGEDWKNFIIPVTRIIFNPIHGDRLWKLG
jgi:hypothetical protein